MASISHRYSIRWIPQPASEPTSTLVLTLASGFYIDIRIQRQIPSEPPECLPASVDDLIRANNFEISQGGSKPRLEIEWAFAGQSKTEPGPPRRCTWGHWVDSKTNLLDGEAISDSGIMETRPDGLTLETGSMPHPETGLETDYEELWEDMPVETPEYVGYGYYVLVIDEINSKDSSHTRGTAVLLGPYYQAIQRQDIRQANGSVATKFAATRWKWDDNGKCWDQILNYCTGDMKLPSPLDVGHELKRQSIGPGVSVKLEGREWLCRELQFARSIQP